MAGRKNRPVLYEIVRRSHRTPESSPRPGPSLLGGLFKPRPVAPDVAARGAPEPELELPGAPRTERPRRGGPVRVLDGRLYLALGWPSALVVAVGLISLLWVAYVAGQTSMKPRMDKSTKPPDTSGALAPSPATPTPAGANTPGGNRGTSSGVQTPPANTTPSPTGPGRTTTPPGPQPPGGGPGPGGTPLPPPTADAPFAAGYYVVVRHVARSRPEDAKVLQELLTSKGLESRLDAGGPDIRVVVVPGAESEAAANAALARVHALGKQTLSDGKLYNFTGARVEKLGAQ
jgi:hypothetical protein